MPRSSRRLTKLALALALTGVLSGSALVAPVSAIAASPAVANVKILSCTDATVVRPVNFVITCADANMLLTATHWSTWNAKGAAGTTRFGMNLCNPYCAASKISYFPDSVVQLTTPLATKHGRLFSQLVVRYRLKGRVAMFHFSWKGDPSFAATPAVANVKFLSCTDATVV